MAFPSADKIEALADYLNSAYSNYYLIFNVSEYAYDTKPFLNQVVGYSFPGYPYLPLEASFTLCKEIDSWLRSDSKNVAMVHCQSSKVLRVTRVGAKHHGGRALPAPLPRQLRGPHRGAGTHLRPAECGCCDAVVPVAETVFGVYREGAGRLRGSFWANVAEILAPDAGESGLRRHPNHHFFEEWGGQQQGDSVQTLHPAFQKRRPGLLQPRPVSARDRARNSAKGFSVKDLSCVIKVGVRIENDTLIRCRHFENNSERVSMFRLYFHTSFVTGNVLRFPKVRRETSVGEDRRREQQRQVPRGLLRRPGFLRSPQIRS